MEIPDGLRTTPFHRSYPADLDTEWIDVCGYAVPLWISDPDSEYTAFRQGVGVLEYSMLYRWHLEGPGALSVANAVHSRNLELLEPGQIAYGVVTTAAGLMVDDCTATSFGPEHVLLVGGNPALGALLTEHLTGRVTLTERREQHAVAAVQGPRSRDLLQRLTDSDLSTASLPYYRTLATTSIAGIPAQLNRIGFTAELGYEVVVPVARAGELWVALFEAGRDLGLQACGAAALMMCRVEGGMVMGDLEYDHTTTPFECRLGWAVDFEKGDFLGRAALEEARHTAPSRVVSLTVEGDSEGLDGASVHHHGLRVGHVTMAVPSPHLGGATLALARVHRDAAQVGTGLMVVLDDGSREATVLATPVYDPERLRVRG